jgi:hypothetical protein
LHIPNASNGLRKAERFAHSAGLARPKGDVEVGKNAPRPTTKFV